MTLFEKVKMICKSRKIAVSALEQICGLSNGTIAYWRSGRPNLKSVALVAQALGMSIDELIEGTDAVEQETA